ncbi:Subtilisin-like protease SBT1.7 [Raphanus sativus]|nr:Subtilisin-like protease SBT1.7 [Raphanus sativus]
MILANTAENGEELVADAHLLPATAVGEKAGDIIRHYVLTDPNPTASVLIQGTIVNVQPSPVVAAFSSRGPNSITPNILKPDLIAPGVNILAGWTGSKGPTGLASDARRVEFNIISGTSMSCPHVSGLAALLKSVHPEWSPAAIRSALMTTAYKTYKDGKPILDVTTGKPSTPFDHGAGHVSPTTAINPGLIYDLTTVDYLGFLCALNYTPSQITSVSRRNYTCDPSKSYSVADLNYPSFAVNVDGSGVYKYARTVTSVGGAGSYSVKVTSETTAVKISVEPAVLNFKEINEKKSYTVTFTVNSSKQSGPNSFGSIEWSDGKHVVASPVAISWT